MFIDESGFSLMPNVRRTWGWRGDTPILCHRASHRKKVSAIAALSLSPRRKRVNLFLATYENESIRQDHVVAFLKQLMRRLRGHIVIVWDNIKTHRSRRVRAYAARHRRLHLTHLPPYAPELNPVEWYWCDGKHHRLANHGFTDLPRLHDAVRSHHAAARKDQRRLRSYLRAAALPCDYDHAQLTAQRSVVPFNKSVQRHPSCPDRPCAAQRSMDYFVCFSLGHLDHVAHQYVAFYNDDRPHQGVGNRPLTPIPPPANRPPLPSGTRG